MAKIKESVTPYSAVPAKPTVEELASAIRTLSRAEMTHLVSLVPDLQRVRYRRAALDRMRKRIRAHALPASLARDGEFIAGLTLDQYLALPDAEREKVWDKLFCQVARETKHRDHPVKRNAVPAGQKRRAA
jgi:hypothetical protein